MRHRNRILCLLLALALLFCFAGCSSNAEMKADEAYEAPAQEGMPDGLYDEANYGGTDTATAPGNAADGQKLIRRVHLKAETEDYAAFVSGLNNTVYQLGGYFEQVDARTSGDAPNATMVIRIPADKLDSLVAHIDGASNVTNRTESQENVTLKYVDTESRIKALRTEESRLLELLEQADSLDTILEIEDRLADVRYQLESAESSLRVLQNQVDYATVSLDVSQVKVFTPVEEEEKGFWDEVGSGFVSSAEGVWEILTGLFKLIVVSLPYLLLIGFLGLIVFLCIYLPMRGKKKRRQKKAAALQTQPAQPSAPTPPAQPIPPTPQTPPAPGEPGPDRL